MESTQKKMGAEQTMPVLAFSNIFSEQLATWLYTHVYIVQSYSYKINTHVHIIRSSISTHIQA